MVIELTLGNVITLAALLIAAGWALVKVITRQQEKNLTQQFETLGKALGEMRQAQDSNAEALRVLERQLLQHEVVMAKEYVRRDDYVRDLASLGTRIDNFALRVERALKNLGEPR